MPFYALRSIPSLSKAVSSRATPNYILMKHLTKQPLNVKLQQDFVNSIIQEQVDSKENLPSSSVFHLPLKGTEELPFHVSRSQFGSLPIYLDYKNGRTKTLTVLRKVKGDVSKLQEDIAKITGEEVVLRAGNQLEIKGNHSRILRLYLRAAGF